MGCNSSSVVPLGETVLADGAGIKVRVNPSTPETVKLNSPPKNSTGCFPRKSVNPPVSESSEPLEETLPTDFNLLHDAGVNMETPPPPPPPPPPPNPPLAFEVPVNEGSIIKKHPPKRFRRLESQILDGAKNLSHEVIDGKQMEAEIRRKEILSQRIQSAQQKLKKLTRQDSFYQKSDDVSDEEKNV